MARSTAVGGGIFFEWGGALESRCSLLKRAWQISWDLTPLPKNISAPAAHLHRYVFDTQQGFVAIVWAETDEEIALPLRRNVTAFDLMGRPLAGTKLQVSSTPIYLRSSRLEDLIV